MNDASGLADSIKSLRPSVPIARASTIRCAIAALERRLLDDLEPRERAEELERLASLRALVRYAR